MIAPRSRETKRALGKILVGANEITVTGCFYIYTMCKAIAERSCT